MNKKLNNKGFTLVELLAVLVILIAIMSIAIPSISSSLERSKAKEREQKEKIILSAAELYVTDHRNNFAESDTVSINSLIDENYLKVEDTKDDDDKQICTSITYKKETNEYICNNS